MVARTRLPKLSKAHIEQKVFAHSSKMPLKNQKQGDLLMKKIIALTLLLCTLVLMFSSCEAEPELAKPEDTNLEYWLLDIPDKKNWTQLTYQGRKTDRYLAQGYEAVVDENGDLCEPEQCVVYYVSNYPLLDLGITQKINCIVIRDPVVNIWGLTINSSSEEIIATLEQKGFTVSVSANRIVGDLGRYTIIAKSGESISINYEMPSIMAALWSIDFD